MLVVLIRSVLLYLILIFTIRLMGKRQIGEMEPSEFVVALLIADLASVPMQDLGIPLLSGIIPILTVLCIELLLSVLTYHFIFIQKLFCGTPVILVENGKILPKNMKKTRITPDELSEQLREKGIWDLSTVKFAILETNGQISALLNACEQPLTAGQAAAETQPVELPVTIISCGRLLRDHMKHAGRSEHWLEEVLRSHHCQISDVHLLTVTQTGKVYLSKMQEDV